MINKKKLSRVFLGVAGGIVAITAFAAWSLYRTAYAPNFCPGQITYVYIGGSDDFSSLGRQLLDSAGCQDIRSFNRLARWLDYPGHMKSGRYAVTPGMNNLTLLNELRRGQQTAVRLTFNNIRTIDELAARIGDQLMMSRNELLAQLTEPTVCAAYGFTPETVKALFIPNTYEVYWTVSPENLLKRMKKEYDRFWNEKRREKAARVGLTPFEVSVLASIVEEETAVADEYPIIAGLYLNRLKRGIPLQADPTVKYAAGDFTLQRILFEHLEIDSPYNTYKYAGLPPGPLRIPGIRSIDAVLSPMQHNYLYMCAKEDFSGRHNFAVTLAEHNRNAARYRTELNRRNIR